jgi:hypothetical protein
MRESASIAEHNTTPWAYTGEFMKLIAIFAVVLGLALSSTPSHAQKTGIELQHECQAVLVTNRTVDEAVNAAHCLGYISGVAYSMTMWEMGNKDKRVALEYVPACLPDSGTNEEYVKVVLHYLDGHPNQLHESYGLVVFFAFHDAYPCHAM